MLTWGFWLLFAVVLCGAAECGLYLEGWIRRHRDPRAAKPPASRGREAAAWRKLRRAR